MEQTIDYQGYTIEILLDHYPENPFSDWDCEPPIIVLNEGSFDEYGLDATVPELSRDEIEANLSDIKMTFGYDRLISALTYHCRHYRGTYYDVAEMVNSALSEYAEQLHNSDKLDLIATVYQWKGIPVVCKSIHGYSQGDYAVVLAVALPEWTNRVGAPHDTLTYQLEGAIRLYANWAYGNVYGFQILDKGSNEIEDGRWFGFYGDPETSGLLEEARAFIENAITINENAKIARLKIMIKNRVPLSIR